MASFVKVPITIARVGGAYTGELAIGASGHALAVLLDTGSSTLAVDGQVFDPLTTPGTRTTNLAQTVQYGVGGWVGAVVQAPVALAPEVVLPAVNLAVTYEQSPGMFSGAQGILGLAYAPLDAAYVMPADTWAARYPVAQLEASEVIDLDPYFSQLEEAGVVGNAFAFAVERATARLATADPAIDPVNLGLLVLGDGAAATELYAGAFTSIAVVHDVWYDTNLIAVQVGDQPAIAVAPPPTGAPPGSNSFVDSGTSTLMLAQPLYDAVVGAFAAIDPTLATLLTTHAVGGAGLDHATLALARWPPLHLTLQGADGAPATLTVPPDAYWQLDAAGAGLALAYLCGDAGRQGGRSILGLPLFCGQYVVFDRAGDHGLGAIRFARRAG